MDAISHRLAIRNLKSIVKQIETLRNHRNTTITERHLDRLPSTNEDHIKLMRLSDKLQEHLQPWRSTREVAVDEVIRLTVEDPILCQILQPLFEQTPGQYAFDGDSFKIHELWSNALRSCSFAPNLLLTRYLENNFTALRNSMRHEIFAYLGPRYLYHILEHNLTGNELYFLVKLWHSYIELVRQTENPEDRVEWGTLNRCFGNLPEVELKSAFVPPVLISEVIARLIELRREASVPNLFSVFFGKPALVFNATKRDRKPSVDTSLFRLLPLYYGAFVNSNTLPAIKTIAERQEGILRDTVLEGNSLWSRYCNVLGDVLRYYRTGFVLEGDTPVNLNPDFEYNLQRTISHSFSLQDFLSGCLEEIMFADGPRREFATLLVECFAAIDLYCKHAVETIHDSLPEYTDLSSKHLRTLRAVTGIPSLPLFDNVPYLRRFRVKGKIYITSDHLPEPPDVLLDSSGALRDFSVQTMSLFGEMILWLSIDGSRSPLRVQNHYPVVAAVGRSGTEYYVAAVVVHHVYYFSYVKVGATSVEYTDECGEPHTSSQFFVLARRNRDDSTFTWRSFWPQRDPEYCGVSSSARQDDEHLLSLLNDMQKSPAKILRFH
ncbi:hypothetical protein SCHPADRAFT_993226 [Schizopora paradoxa]|uniref:Uncharacterized protein n=1 Tax=Schizopora paradoxa TaxID=27342 RepID=A0A0H2S466_9AGAM|nr:hypothetical protein SCHPADRAFT_993226 [Schizopora paradoxa]